MRHFGYAPGVTDAQDARFTPVPRSYLGGKYETVRPVGRGGMASVWLGLNRGAAGFARKIAIKRVLRHLKQNDTRFEQMFVEEALIVADLHHPNIVQVHDFGRDMDGGYYIVMEWVEGLNLTSYIDAYKDAGELPPWHLCMGICIEVLRALSAAHGRTDDAGRPAPVIHRDVTPANILIGINGNVKLTDFGLASAMDRPGTTEPGMVKGKIAYVSPEVLKGARADPRTDLYGLGVVLWEALTTKRLFGGEKLSDLDIAMRVLKLEVPPLSEVRPGLPPEVYQLVARGIARDPAERFQTAQEMIGALTAILRRHPEPSDVGAVAQSAKRARSMLEPA
jgi:serine/threonine-protein kinase